MATPLLDGIQRRLDEKEAYLKAAKESEFSNLAESVANAETEIERLKNKYNRNKIELSKVEKRILASQKEYWTAGFKMEEAIHQFICIKNSKNNKERKHAVRNMTEW
jgi:predicted  nucleic acid-binding Zn-ribbon protein